MSDLLSRMAKSSAKRAAEARARESTEALRRRAFESPPPPELRLAPRGFDLFAEIKRRAPSAGRLADAQASVARRAATYAAAGPAVISVLTEPDEFGGSLGDLREAACATSIPVMRKDFLTDPYQILEARAAGAAGVLLILRMLDESRLGELLDAAAEARLFVLLEASDEADLSRAEGAVARAGLQLLCGVNARDLVSLAVDRERFGMLRPRLPADLPAVAESGLASIDDVRHVAALGYRAALVGSALMREKEPGQLLQQMIRAGREEASRSCACE